MPYFNLNDSINLLSKLTLRRFWNGFKVYSSFRLSRLISKPIQWGMPVSISFEPTTSCNLRCPECPSGLREFTRPTGMLQKNFFQETIDEIAQDILYLIFYFQGEPYLNPQFLEMVKYANQKGIYTATSTNAHYLNDENARKTVESGLDRLIISIDGTTQDVYQQYRVGGKLDKVIEGAKNIVKWKKQLNSKTPFVFFQFLVVKPNEHQIADIKALGREIGVDQVRFKTAQVYNYQEDPNNLIPTNNKYSRYKKDASGKMKVKSGLKNYCWKLWHANVITWDGLVVPCCFDKDAMHQLGNLKSQSFKEIWKNSNYHQFRKELLNSRKNIDICSNCSEGLSVWED
ncbi:MAG TPA: radical SAM/SPASM domain-containing protein [Sediminibacterium sp.]|uniref:radical SAM/SPASM domain-containing protein n=1 Tax=Sediminibacterium sp. TaxID=1917865 RepID=UPI0008BB71AC|nr:radical SAM/SPASM domain-containing protein [Sediminibacterium sp.]MBT9483999.1 SPASM domain-containing protein [Sediminibacterium sp.]OHC86155.1 MAG: radical SAM protein [Sphingobacteriia bacterium RIFOXYC2_FULL_35_18]OHC89668.1 MAG: radical SAM protein [Sphingobacteriia bacterium RIFOXYD2_FULL_35_12]HLD54451.1 radical SAM/SPASM domain-containing protein [Sediminibacterium sp.]